MLCWRIVGSASHYWYRQCEQCTRFQLTWPSAFGYFCDSCLMCHLAFLQNDMKKFEDLVKTAMAPCPTRAPEGSGLP
jgi:hypothetical protein